MGVRRLPDQVELWVETGVDGVSRAQPQRKTSSPPLMSANVTGHEISRRNGKNGVLRAQLQRNTIFPPLMGAVEMRYVDRTRMSSRDIQQEELV